MAMFTPHHFRGSGAGSTRRGKILAVVLSLTFLGAGCARAPRPTPPPPGGIYRSDDGGVTFIQRVALADGGHLARIEPREVGVSVAKPHALVLAANGAVFRTGDRGDTWVRLPVPARDIVSVSVHPRNPEILLAAGVGSDRGGRGIIVKSLDGGASWAEIFAAPPSEEERGVLVRRRAEVATRITVVAHDPHAPEVVFAGTNTGVLLVSTDGGVRWTTRSSFKEGIVGLKLSQARPGRILARLAGGRALRSSNGGASFERSAVGRPTLPFLGTVQRPEVLLSVLFVPGDAGGEERILAGTETGLYQSDDSGETWAALPLPPTGKADVPVRSLAQTTDGTLWAASGFVLLFSKDGGATWRTANVPLAAPIRFVVADPQDPERLYLFFAASPQE